MIHNNEVISIEEDLLNCRQMIRRFTFNNRNNNLRIGVLTIGATIVSCELDSHQIVVNHSHQYNNQHNNHYHNNTIGIDLTTTGVGRDQLSPASRTNWISHVRGPDTLSLTSGLSSSQSQSIVYQLTQENQLIVTGRFKSQQQLLNPYYFNLNSATSKPSLDGHYLHIRSSDTSAQIRQQITSNNCAADNEINFVTPLGREIPMTSGVGGADGANELDFDAIYCLTTPASDAKLMATLRFENRAVEVTVVQNGANGGQPQVATGGQTAAAAPVNPLKLRVRIVNGAVCIMPALMNEFKCIYKFVW